MTPREFLPRRDIKEKGPLAWPIRLCFWTIVLFLFAPWPFLQAQTSETRTISFEIKPTQLTYPTVLMGLKEVLSSDLHRAGNFKLTSPSGSEISIELTAEEQASELHILLRIYDLQSNYNLGSQRIIGSYGDIKGLQDQLFQKTAAILRVSTQTEKFQQIQQTHTKNIGALHRIGSAGTFVSKNQNMRALEEFSKAKKLDPKFGAANERLSKIGSDEVQRLKDPQQKAQAYRQMNQAKLSLREYDRALKLNPKHVKALVGKAKLLLSLGQASDSISLLLKAQSFAPKNLEVASHLAKAYFESGNKRRGYSFAQKAIRLGSKDPELFHHIGVVQQNRRNFSEATRSYRKAAKLSHQTVDLRNASKYHAKANRLRPNSSGIQRQAEILITTGQQELAISVLNKALLSRPNDDKLMALQGKAYFANGQPSRAAQKFLQAINFNSSNFVAHYHLGIIYSDAHHTLDKAIGHLEKAASLKPDQVEPKLLLARLYINHGLSAKAVTILETFAQSYPNNHKVQKRLGDAYLEHQDYILAIEAYKKAIGIYPKYLGAHEGLVKAYILADESKEKIFSQIEKVYEINASDNLLIRDGMNLLGGLTSKKFVAMANMFPKVVETSTGKSFINQVALIELEEPQSILKTLREYFQPFIVNQSRLSRDLELALYSRYRVVKSGPGESLGVSAMVESEFMNKELMDDLASPSKLEGVFSYRVLESKRGPNSDQIKVELLMHSVLDGGLHSLPSQDAIPIAFYPKRHILIFNPKAPLAYGIALFLLIAPITYFTIYRARKRGWGNVRVLINYDPKLESFLTLKLSRKKEKEKNSNQLIVKDKAKYQKKKFKQLLKQKGAWVRQMVGRETIFENVPARTYYCYLFGTIQDTGITKSTVGNYYMEQKFTLKKGENKELMFQLQKEEAFVTVFVRKGEAFVSGSEVNVEGLSETRYARAEDGTFFYLKPGTHKIRVKHEGRTLEQAIEIIDLEDRQIHFDVLTMEEAQQLQQQGKDVTEVASDFKESGRFEEAAKLYEESGDQKAAYETRAQAFISEGNSEAAAKVYWKAKDFLKAAEIFQELGQPKELNLMYGYYSIQQGDFSKAASYLENANDLKTLAKVYKKLGQANKAHAVLAKYHLASGQKLEAAKSFVQCEEFSSAAEIYEELGEHDKAAVLYAKDGNFSLAAHLFAQSGDLKKAALAFEKGGSLEEAIPIYEELQDDTKVIELLKRSSRDVEAAHRCFKLGLIDQAIEICQKVSPEHTEFIRSQALLATLLLEKGHDDIALQTLKNLGEETLQGLDSETTYTYGLLLEKNQKFEESLKVFEDLVKRDFHFKDASQKVSHLKEKAKSAKATNKVDPNTETINGSVTHGIVRYEILEELGRGAMGVVFKAKDKKLDRTVAFKTLPHTLKNDQDAFESLKREAQTAAKLNHPNIVTVYDVGEEAGNYFIAMEFVQGKTLDSVLKQVKRMNIKNLLSIAKPLCEVIDYAHNSHIIHRDIKPSNIILLPASRTVKLMDFGLAKILQDMVIDKTMLRGTPLYMSPEQVLGKEIDHRTDIYSLGVLFYECLCGQPPFSDGDIMYAHVHTLPPHLKERTSGIPNVVTDIVMACLHKDKNDRPSSATEVFKQLSTS